MSGYAISSSKRENQSKKIILGNLGRPTEHDSSPSYWKWFWEAGNHFFPGCTTLINKCYQPCGISLSEAESKPTGKANMSFANGMLVTHNVSEDFRCPKFNSGKAECCAIHSTFQKLHRKSVALPFVSQRLPILFCKMILGTLNSVLGWLNENDFYISKIVFGGVWSFSTLLPPCLPSQNVLFGLLLAATATLSPKLVLIHNFPFGLLLAAAAALSPKLVSLHDF